MKRPFWHKPCRPVWSNKDGSFIARWIETQCGTEERATWSKHPFLSFTPSTAAVTLAQKNSAEFFTISGELCIILSAAKIILIFFPIRDKKIMIIILKKSQWLYYHTLSCLESCLHTGNFNRLCIVSFANQRAAERSHYNYVSVFIYSFSF